MIELLEPQNRPKIIHNKGINNPYISQQGTNGR
jgi:hypothetical protein